MCKQLSKMELSQLGQIECEQTSNGWLQQDGFTCQTSLSRQSGNPALVMLLSFDMDCAGCNLVDFRAISMYHL